MDAQTAAELAAGARLGDTYELVRLLGKGGMGTVWEASHLRLPKHVAIKVLTADAGVDTMAFARFRREAEITTKLGHPNIVEIYDFNTLPGGSPYIVLELLSGETLAARLQRGPIELEEAMRIGRQLASALMAAHREQVVHRDLKPGNVFLCPREVDGARTDHVKVLDFGVSKIVGSATLKTSDSTVLGTPRYMAPEQLTAPETVDARADQFTLAAIVYEMLSGEPLFRGDLAGTLYQIAHGTPTLTALEGRFPERVTTSLARALSHDPAARYPDVVAFMAECSGRSADTVEGRGMAVKPAPGAPEHSPARAPQRPAQAPQGVRPSVAVASVAVVALVALGAWWVLRAPPEPIAAPPERPPVVTAPPRHDAPEPAPSPAPAAGPAPAPDPGLQLVLEQPHGPKRIRAGPPKLLRPPGHINPALHLGPPLKPNVPPLEVERELAQAQNALAAGDISRASFLATHSLLGQQTSQAYSILTQAACKAHDLGKARANLFKVGPDDKQKVVTACRASGIDLQ